MVSIGTIIGDRYEILEKVGSGGMADVFRAKCHRLNRYVAIKILKQDYSEDTKFVTKFRGEAQAIAGISHLLQNCGQRHRQQLVLHIPIL